MVVRKYDAANLLCLLFTYMSVSFVIVAIILNCAPQRAEGVDGPKHSSQIGAPEF